MKDSKRHFFILLFALSAWASAFAWHEYQPMVVEGRRWDIGVDRSYIIEGDTIFEGQTFKKVYDYDFMDDNHEQLYRKDYYCAVREEDKKVYILVDKMDGNPTVMLLCDFSWGLLNHSCEELGIGVHSAFNTMIHGTERRVINTIPIFGEFLRPLIEGVGYHEAPFDPYYGTDIVSGCYDGSHTLYDIDFDGSSFTKEDISPITDGEVNGDGHVDIADVNAVINVMLGKPVGPRCDDVAADMNLNGKIDIADVNAVINVMLGRE